MKKAISLAAAAAIALGQAASTGLFTATAADSTEFPYKIEGEDLEGATLWTSIYENKIPNYSGEGSPAETSALQLTFLLTVCTQ